MCQDGDYDSSRTVPSDTRLHSGGVRLTTILTLILFLIKEPLKIKEGRKLYALTQHVESVIYTMRD